MKLPKATYVKIISIDTHEFKVLCPNSTPLLLNFRPFVTLMEAETRPWFIQHYMAAPRDKRTMCLYCPFTQRYYPVDLTRPVIIHAVDVIMIMNGASRPTMRQPECVNVLVGKYMADL